MSFFEPPPPPQPPEPGPPPPEWFGPPENMVPTSFPLELLLTRTEELALFVHSGRAFVHGFEFTLALHTRRLRDRQTDPMMGWHGAPRLGFDEGVLRFGIEFADGRKATIFDAHPWWGAEPEQPTTPDIVLTQRGGGGGGKRWEFGHWAWPLPPEGPLAFVAEWPAEGIQLTRAELDSAVIRDAAARAVTLWPGEPPEPRGAIWTRGNK